MRIQHLAVAVDVEEDDNSEKGYGRRCYDCNEVDGYFLRKNNQTKATLKEGSLSGREYGTLFVLPPPLLAGMRTNGLL